MRVFVCFFAFFGAKIWPAAAGTGELARDLRDQTPVGILHVDVSHENANSRDFWLKYV